MLKMQTYMLKCMMQLIQCFIFNMVIIVYTRMPLWKMHLEYMIFASLRRCLA